MGTSLSSPFEQSGRRYCLQTIGTFADFLKELSSQLKAWLPKDDGRGKLRSLGLEWIMKATAANEDDESALPGMLIAQAKIYANFW